MLGRPHHFPNVPIVPDAPDGVGVPLADTVLPLIRTRAELHRWGVANAHGRQMHEALDILEAAIPAADPAEVYSVTHRALASAINGRRE